MKGVDHQNDAYQDLLDMKAIHKALPIVEEAVGNGLFDFLDSGREISEVEAFLKAQPSTAAALLDVLKEMGLVILDGPFVCNAPISSNYLVSSSPLYSGMEFLKGTESPKYIAQKLVPILEHFDGTVFLEVGQGTLCSVAFLEALRVLGIEIGQKADDSDGEELSLILTECDDLNCLDKMSVDSIVGILGSFEGFGGLHSAIKRYEQRIEGANEPGLSVTKVEQWAKATGHHYTPLLSLTRQTSVLFVSKNADSLKHLAITNVQQIMAKIRRLPVERLTFLDPKDIVTAEWVVDHCRYGCSSYGTKCCPPNSPTCDESKTRFQEYSKALLIEGQPPGRSFQSMMLQAEKIAFKQGYYKAFAYWAGPCDLCTECNPPEAPLMCTATRPSMESAGIDVFATVHKLGYSLRTLKDRKEYVKYFGLLLLE